MNAWTVVTGASGGLGREVAAQLSRSGSRVLWLIHPSDNVEDLPLGANDACVALDLAHDQIATSIRRLGDTYPDVSCLIHCTGSAYYAALAEITDSNALTTMRVNLFAPILLTHVWGRSLEARGGSLVVVSSVVAASRNPNYSLYSATKAALEHFAASLQAESPTIAVTIVRPGAMRTAFHARSGVPFPVRNALAPDVAARRLVAAIGHRGVCYLRQWERVIPFAHRVRDVVELIPLPRRSRGTPGGPVVITGASQGIGAALQSEMSRDGLVTHGWARRPGQRTSVVDVRDWKNAPLDTIGLVLNAGVNHAGRFVEMPQDDIVEMLATNAESVVMLALRHLRLWRAEPQRWLLVVSSLAAQLGYPGSATYGSTKALVSRFTLALRSSTNMRVGVVWPGPVDTEQARRASPRRTSGVERVAPAAFAATLWRSWRDGQDLIFGRASWRLAAIVATLFPAVIMRVMRRAMLPRTR